MGSLFCFSAITERRVYDANMLKVLWQATVYCLQPEYSGVLISCQVVDLPFSIGIFGCCGAGFCFLVRGGGQGVL